MKRLLSIAALAAFLAGPAEAEDAVVVSSSADAAAARSEETAWERRARLEHTWRDVGVSLIPHQQSYFLPVTYNTAPHGSSATEPESFEAKFQVSFKVLLLNDIRKSNLHLYFGYTQLSLWQVYERERSTPFRDTNHEPEAFLSWDGGAAWGPALLREVDLGVVHQSNGVRFPDSRSWNRVFARVQVDAGPVAVTLRPWVRLPERSGQDENPDIVKYLGHGELTLAWAMRNHVISMMVRNNFRTDRNRGAVRLDYTFPFTRNLTGLVQYFSGYGESLLDYNRPTNRLSVGIALTD